MEISSKQERGKAGGRGKASARMKLTDATVKALPDGSRVYDTALPGFGVYVTPAGVRSYFAAFRVAGKDRRITIGRADVLTADKARREAKALMGAAERGVDPVEERRREAREAGRETLAEFWSAEYLPTMRKQWKPGTVGTNTWLWENRLGKALGKKRLAEITRADVVRFLRDHEDAPVVANQSFRLLRAMLNRALDLELIPTNPASRVKQHAEKGRERFLTVEEVQRLFAAIAEEERLGGLASVERAEPSQLDPAKVSSLIERLAKAGKAPKRTKSGALDKRQFEEPTSRGISPFAAGLFRLLIYTGARLTEIQLARWDWVRWEERVLALPDSKTGARRVPLNEQAIAELRRLQQLRSQDTWIIEGRLAGAALVNPQKPWQRVRRAAGLEDVRIHDLRHSFASFAVAGGMALPLVGKMLGHSQARTTERYAHLADAPMLDAAELVGALIVDAVARPAAKVEDIAEGRRVR
ncbi:tyrosine-type recombinase/integrase [bacterium]|nr:tyrosine-type recombinase/integrase [bacterium]